jgi:hypothetical protein
LWTNNYTQTPTVGGIIWEASSRVVFSVAVCYRICGRNRKKRVGRLFKGKKGWGIGKLTAGIFGAFGLIASVQAALLAPVDGQVYDDVLGIRWLQDANLIKTLCDANDPLWQSLRSHNHRQPLGPQQGADLYAKRHPQLVRGRGLDRAPERPQLQGLQYLAPARHRSGGR